MPEIIQSEYTYYAFISYKREDEEWAKWLQDKLESYGFPVALRKDNSSLPTKIKPIFRDKTDLSSGNLSEEIEEALSESKYLIVICSPRAAQSPWVSKEVQYFIDKGREKNIIPFIIGGSPNAKNPEEECFPEGLRQLSGEKEILGININEMGRDAAAIKVIARMFGLRFDTLWQRHERAKRRKRFIIFSSIISFSLIILIIGVFVYNQNIRLTETTKRMRQNQVNAVTEKASELLNTGDTQLAQLLCLELLSYDLDDIDKTGIEGILRRANTTTKSIITVDKKGAYLTEFGIDDENNIGVIGSSVGELFIYDLDSGKLLRNWKAHYDKIYHIQFSDDKKRFLTHSINEDGGFSIKVWDCKTWDLIGNLELKKDESIQFWLRYSKPIFLQNSEMIGFVTQDHNLMLWNWKSNKKVIVKNLELNNNDIDYSKDNGLILSISNKKIVLLDEFGKILSILDKIKIVDIEKIRFISKGEILTVDQKGNLKIWDISTQKCVNSYRLPNGNLTFICEIGDKNLLYAIQSFSKGGYPETKIYNLAWKEGIGWEEDEFTKTIPYPQCDTKRPLYLSLSKGKYYSLNGDRLYIDYISTVHENNFNVQEFNLHNSKKIISLNLDNSGRYIATCASDGTIKLLDILNKRQVGYTVHENIKDNVSIEIKAPKYTKKGVIVAATQDKIKIWDVISNVALDSIQLKGKITSILLNNNRFLWVGLLNTIKSPIINMPSKSEIRIYDLENNFNLLKIIDFVDCTSIRLSQSKNEKNVLVTVVDGFSVAGSFIYNALSGNYIGSIIFSSLMSGVLSISGDKIYLYEEGGLYEYTCDNDSIPNNYYHLDTDMASHIENVNDKILIGNKCGFSIFNPISRRCEEYFNIGYDYIRFSNLASNIILSKDSIIKVIPYYSLESNINIARARLKNRELTQEERRKYYLE